MLFLQRQKIKFRGQLLAFESCPSASSGKEHLCVSEGCPLPFQEITVDVRDNFVKLHGSFLLCLSLLIHFLFLFFFLTNVSNHHSVSSISISPGVFLSVSLTLYFSHYIWLCFFINPFSLSCSFFWFTELERTLKNKDTSGLSRGLLHD